jgi:hypothetical protein
MGGVCLRPFLAQSPHPQTRESLRLEDLQVVDNKRSEQALRVLRGRRDSYLPPLAGLLASQANPGLGFTQKAVRVFNRTRLEWHQNQYESA